MTLKVEKELQTATGVTPKSKEPRQKYLRRLVEGTEKLKDDAWDGLSASAQEWYNTAADAYKDDEEIADFEQGNADEEKPKGKGKKAEAEDGDGEAEALADDDDKTRDDDKAKDDDEDDEKPKGKGKKEKSKKKESADEDDEDDKKDSKKKVAKSKDGNGEDGARSQSSTARTEVYRQLVADPSKHKQDIHGALKKKGIKIKVGAVGAMRRHFRHVVAFLQAEKLMPKKFDL